MLYLTSQQLGLLHLWLTPFSTPYILVIKLSNQRIKYSFPWFIPFVVPFISLYVIPGQLMKPPLWIYIHPLPTPLCCCWEIKIFPKLPIRNTKCFCCPLYLPLTTPLDLHLKNIHNIFHLNILIFPHRKIL